MAATRALAWALEWDLPSGLEEALASATATEFLQSVHTRSCPDLLR